MTVLNRELFSGIGVASVHAVRPWFRFVPRSGIKTCDGKLFRSVARSFVLGWWPRGWRFSWNSRTLFRISALQMIMSFRFRRLPIVYFLKRSFRKSHICWICGRIIRCIRCRSKNPMVIARGYLRFQFCRYKIFLI